MKYCEENQYHPKLVCNKGNMLLNEIKMPLTNNKAYNLQFEFNNLNMSKVNSNLLLTTQLYELLEKVNVDLIENIHILNVLNDRETDICIILKQIAKEVGIKQKYGGRYLPENHTYAAQTIAHNTIVADEISHFKGTTFT